MIDFSAITPEDSLFGDVISENLDHRLFESSLDSDLSDDGIDSDPSFFPYSVAALPLDTDPANPKSGESGSCLANPDILPSGFQIFDLTSPNPFIPMCEAAEHTLCCAGTPETSPESSLNLGSGFFTFPYLENADSLVNVKECVICTYTLSLSRLLSQ